MFVLIATLNRKIIFWKYIGEDKKGIEYLLAYTALDTEDPVVLEGCTAKTTILESGHRIIITRGADEILPVEDVIRELKDALFNPFIDCCVELPHDFCKKVLLKKSNDIAKSKDKSDI